MLVLTAVSSCGNVSDTPAETPQAEANIPFGYDKYDALLKAYVDEVGMVNYSALKNDRGDLDAFIASLGALDKAEVQAWTREEQLTLWINAYNAITLQRIIDHYPIKKGGIISSLRYPANSIRQIPGVWKKLTTPVAGRSITLDKIEHEILRVQFDEPRIHAAIVCAAQSCPPLRNEAFRPESIEDQLASQSANFLSSKTRFRIDRTRKEVQLSAILDWFGEDFVEVYNTEAKITGHGSETDAVLDYVSRYVSDEDAQFLQSEDYSVSFLDYDWLLNEQ